MMLSACTRFRSGIKDLEVMMQNLIVTAFETVTTVEQGVEVLDIFMHLSSREVTLITDQSVSRLHLFPILIMQRLVGWSLM